MNVGPLIEYKVLRTYYCLKCGYTHAKNTDEGRKHIGFKKDGSDWFKVNKKIGNRKPGA